MPIRKHLETCGIDNKADDRRPFVVVMGRAVNGWLGLVVYVSNIEAATRPIFYAEENEEQEEYLQEEE